MRFSIDLADPRSRSRLYATLAAAFFLMACGGGLAKAVLLGQPFDLPVSDGRYYYAYLPSAVLDGDLDFRNQYAEHWGPDFEPALLEGRTPTGLVPNKYPVGLALTLLPGFLFGHLVTWLLGLSPAGGYGAFYQLGCLALIEILVWRTLVLADRLLVGRFRVSPQAALFGLVFTATTSAYAYYAGREPFMAHAVSAFWCTCVVALAAAGERGPRRLWPRLGFCFGMALVCRPTNAYLTPVALYGMAQAVRAAGWRATLRWLPAAATGLVPVGLQMLTWRVLDGSWVYYSYEGAGFSWAHPALWETLFSSRHGLFFWSPLLLAAVAFLPLRWRDPLVWWWSLGAVLLWYANSAWFCWWFGDAFGGRAFLELFALFALGSALAAEALARRPRLVAAAFLAGLIFNGALLTLYVTHRIPRDGYLFERPHGTTHAERGNARPPWRGG
jgi:hypothetical protein